MIYILEGKPGSGKSYSAVREMCADLAQGSIVVTNMEVFPIAIAKFVLKHYGVEIDVASIVKMHGTEIWENFGSCCPMGDRQVQNKLYFDECHEWMSSREFSRNYKEFKKNFVYASQHRKFFVDIILISQAAHRIDVQFRDLAQFYKRYRDLQKVTLPFLGQIWPFAHSMEYIIDYDGRTMHGRNVIPRTIECFGLYNSEQLLMTNVWTPAHRRGTIKKRKGNLILAQAWMVAEGASYLAIGWSGWDLLNWIYA